MKFLNFSSWLRVVIIATSVLCVLLAFAMARDEAANGLVPKKPSVILQASRASVTYPCPEDMHSASRTCPTTIDMRVALTSTAKGFNNPNYSYIVTGGRIIGEGGNVGWDLYDAGPGFYRATVEVRGNKKPLAAASVDVMVQTCIDCVTEWPCPTLFATCYEQVNAGTPITCKVVIGASSNRGPVTFEWSARDSSGGDLSERISRRDRYISIRTDGLGGQRITATVKVNGLYPSCATTAASSTVVKP